MRANLLLAVCTILLFPPTLAMSQPHCVSHLGETVPYFSDFSMPDVGRASRDQFGRPLILINPNILSQAPRMAQSFWLYHECAHHALPPHMNNESNADCYAVQHMRNTGQINNHIDMNDMFFSISQLQGSSWGHLPGPARAQNMWNCLNF